MRFLALKGWFLCRFSLHKASACFPASLSSVSGSRNARSLLDGLDSLSLHPPSAHWSQIHWLPAQPQNIRLIQQVFGIIHEEDVQPCSGKQRPTPSREKHLHVWLNQFKLQLLVFWLNIWNAIHNTLQVLPFGSLSYSMSDVYRCLDKACCKSLSYYTFPVRLEDSLSLLELRIQCQKPTENSTAPSYREQEGNEWMQTDCYYTTLLLYCGLSLQVNG